MDQIDEITREQYKIMVETSCKVTEWRHSANNFYLTVNTTLIAVATYLLTTSKTTTQTLCATGMIIAFLWFRNIESYKKLNAAKFKVIQDMEEKMPVPIFTLERKHYKNNKREAFTTIEKYVPALFGAIYLVILILSFSK